MALLEVIILNIDRIDRLLSATIVQRYGTCMQHYTSAGGPSCFKSMLMQ